MTGLGAVVGLAGAAGAAGLARAGGLAGAGDVVWSAPGAVAGGLAGVGLLVLWWRLDARRVRLDDRLAPYLRTRVRSRLLAGPRGVAPWAAAERLVAPVLADAVRLVTRLGSPTAQLRRRLQRAGRDEAVEQFRVGQVVAGAAGLAIGLVLALAVAAARGGSGVPAALVLVTVAAGAGALTPEQLLVRQVARREERIAAELPTVAELLALSVAAGEGVVGALERVARTTRGALAGELTATLADVRAGAPLGVALDRLADRTGVPALVRLAEGVAVAVERGTPLAEVLRAQAADAREQGRRALMESGGRREVAMMVPVVLLLLPVTVVFMVYPSLLVLSGGW